MKVLPLALLLCACLPALADDSALLRCRAIGDVGARVACYDAIPVGAAQAAPKAAAPARTPEQNFGMEAVKQREEQPASIASTIPGRFEGWGPNTQIRLANGQVWRIVDGSEAVLTPKTDTPVRIERNVFGTLFLKIDGTNSSAKVRRVQ